MITRETERYLEVFMYHKSKFYGGIEKGRHYIYDKKHKTEEYNHLSPWVLGKIEDDIHGIIDDDFELLKKLNKIFRIKKLERILNV